MTWSSEVPRPVWRTEQLIPLAIVFYTADYEGEGRRTKQGEKSKREQKTTVEGIETDL